MSTKQANKQATMDDVLAAVSGVGQKVDHLAGKVDALDKRVTVLEQKPALKPRVVHQVQKNGSAPQPAAKPVPQPAVRQDDDDGEDEAIRSGTWEKVIKQKPCNRVSITKTRNRDAWKLLLHMPGLRRPATFIGWDGHQEIVDFFSEVMPWLNDDYFDQAEWEAMDGGSGTPPVFHQQEVNFLVDWFKTAPNGRGHTFVNVEAVYPVA
jgi:hypothetical protein